MIRLAVMALAVVLLTERPAAAQDGNTCLAVTVPLGWTKKVPSAPLLSQSAAQRLMNELSKETASRAMTVTGVIIVRYDGHITALWMQGNGFICNGGPYDLRMFEAVYRTVFGVDG